MINFLKYNSGMKPAIILALALIMISSMIQLGEAMFENSIPFPSNSKDQISESSGVNEPHIVSSSSGGGGGGSNSNYGLIVVDIFNDTNHNGIRDNEEELGLSGWKVRIDGMSRRVNLTSDDNGQIISRLRPGNYSIEINQKIGWVCYSTPINQINIKKKESVFIYFGENPYSSLLEVQVYEDTNGNGNMDEGEKGLAEWEIVTNCTESSHITTTDKDGRSSINLQCRVDNISVLQKDGWDPTTETKLSLQNIYFGEREITNNSIIIDSQDLNNHSIRPSPGFSTINIFISLYLILLFRKYNVYKRN